MQSIPPTSSPSGSAFESRPIHMPDTNKIIGAIVERHQQSSNINKDYNSSGGNGDDEGIKRKGFPSVFHRSKAKTPSAFARARRDERPPVVLPSAPVNVQTPSNSSTSPSRKEDNNSWRDQMSLSNEQRVAAMTDEEREEARAEIARLFGKDVAEVLKKGRVLREREQEQTQEQGSNGNINNSSKDIEMIESNNDDDDDDDEPMPSLEDFDPSELKSRPTTPPHPPQSPHPPILISSTHPRSRSLSPSNLEIGTGTGTGTSTPNSTKRKLRFADITPEDVHVYESLPSSPRRILGVLTPPPEAATTTIGSERTDSEGGNDPVPIVKFQPFGSNLKLRKLVQDVEKDKDANADVGVADATTTNAADDGPSNKYDEDKKKNGLGLDLDSEELEEGTPEHIRRIYFPNADPSDPSISWLRSHSSSSTQPTTQAQTPPTRFTLHGTPLTASQIRTLPTHLGLHHHANGDEAGYTLDDIFLLAHSAMGGQRVGMLSVLGRVVRRVGSASTGASAVSEGNEGRRHGINELATKDDEEVFRRKALGVGFDALLDSSSAAGRGGGVGVIVGGVDVIWECVVNWGKSRTSNNDDGNWEEWDDEELDDVEMCSPISIDSTNLNSDENTTSATPVKSTKPTGDILTTLPTAHLLPFISSQFNVNINNSQNRNQRNTSTSSHILPQSSLLQLLTILIKLSQHSNAYVTEIVGTSDLVRGVVGYFLLPVGEISSSFHGKREQEIDIEDDDDTKREANGEGEGAELALRLLKILAMSSRKNAESIIDEGVGDILLRFVVVSGPITPPSPSRQQQQQQDQLRPPNQIDQKNKRRTTMMRLTFELYTIWSKYGLYSGIVAVLGNQLGILNSYIISVLTYSPQFASNNRLLSTTLNKQNHLTLNLTSSYLHLIESWLTCSIDPHQTTPAHDILWSQVVALGMGEVGLEVRDAFVTGSMKYNAENKGVNTDEDMNMLPTLPLWTALWRTLSAYLAGCRLNAASGGAKERRDVLQRVKDGFVADGGAEMRVVEGAIQILEDVVNGLSESEEKSPNSVLGKKTCKLVKEASGCLMAYVQFCLACWPIVDDSSSSKESEPKTNAKSHPLCSLSRLRSLNRLIDSLLRSPLFSQSSRTKASFYIYSRPLTSFLAYYIRLLRVLEAVGKDEWLRLTIGVLCVLGVGDEDYAQWIAGEVLLLLTPDKLNILSPFINYTIRPSMEVILSPYVPSSSSLKVSTTQRIPAACRSSQPHPLLISPTADSESESPSSGSGSGSSRPGFGLPLSSITRWSTCALDHLLKSGSSPVFQQWEKNFDSGLNLSEVDIVKACLGLTLEVQKVLFSSEAGEDEMRAGSSSGLSLEEVVFACMEVFMLEHGQQHDDSSEEVFRDAEVEKLMDGLLKPYTFSNVAKTRSHTLPQNQPTLEEISKSFLGTSTPFYQFYTDFVGLYDALSFSHPLFSRLLLVPISMSYPIDFRKYFWGDYGHILRTLRVPVNQIVTNDIQEYLYPIEDDPEMISWYLRALFKWQLDGFAYWIAIHHVACNIWPDLQNPTSLESPSSSLILSSSQTSGKKNDTDTARRKKLLRAVIHQGNAGVIKDIFRYNQPGQVEGEGTDIRLPPECFDIKNVSERDIGDCKALRLRCLCAWEGEKVKEQYGRILSSD